MKRVGGPAPLWVVGVVTLLSCVSAYIPVYVMLPLDAVTNNNQVNNLGQLTQQLTQLKQGGVDGFMTDVWWGLVERSPNTYDWSAYQTIVQTAYKVGLKVKITMSFHQCGGNVGDTCNIPLPSWVLQVGQKNADIFYTDREGNRDQECLSSGVDHQPIFPNNRTAVDMYTNFMQSFAQNFSQWLGNTVAEVLVGMGPAGEMRYPSYQLSRWSFPGIGEFQCYDKYLLSDLQNAATQAGHTNWGTSGPNNAGTYNNIPSSTAFFSANNNDNYASPYGQFFLGWYSQRLIQHGSDILTQARNIFKNYNGLGLAGKVAGIHWWYKDPSHAAELTAGYKNDQGQGYLAITNMFAKYNAMIDFTCLEMRDNEQQNCGCGPEELVGQTMSNAKSSGIGYEGENALPRFDTTAYSQIEYEATRVSPSIRSFDYLRLGSDLLSNQNWNTFTQFVAKMHSLN